VDAAEYEVETPLEDVFAHSVEPYQPSGSSGVLSTVNPEPSGDLSADIEEEKSHKSSAEMITSTVTMVCKLIQRPPS